MSNLQTLLGKLVDVEISGNNCFQGILIDYGLDILTVYNKRFLYIPIVHIQQIKLSQWKGTELDPIGELPIKEESEKESETISFRKILNHAKGSFIEIYVTGNKTLHGYLTSIMNDYFVFHSPVYKTVYVSMNHLKWLIPYSANDTPYQLNHDTIPFHPANVSLARTFRDQCKKMEGKLAVFDLGDHPNKIGLLKQVNVDNNLLELVVANGEQVHWNLQHLKTLFIP
ncbi:DUF2642 domain-containing protein [Fodinisporobacter ferrooxydans]|uniref:DUF2642 domain-containing protein n=1 Tax=Fodinisporobacter ferrooxydans TaxID=2901836 RepID=A0ABY4CGL5_9BACL|nr:DUF2642 domain-containing protein [Alicyclobacillaceae bacterium MYW30-H2]